MSTTEKLFSGQAFQLEREGKLLILTFDLQGEKVNKFGAKAIPELEQALDIIEARKDATALLARSAKPGSFIVGADIELIQSLKDKDAARGAAERGQRMFNRIDDLKLKTLVAVEGPCMGGGLEFALSFDHRVVSDSDKTALAVPEVKLGFLPGWGGTWRLPTIVGLPAALDMMLTGKSIRAAKAEKMGLADKMIPSAIFQEKALEYARELAEGKKPLQRKDVSLMEKGLSSLPGSWVVLRKAKPEVQKATGGHYPAPPRILKQAGLRYLLPRSKFLEEEAKSFAELWSSSVSKNLVQLFFLVEGSKKVSGTKLSGDELKKLPPIREVGVLGAGIMGGGIAAQCARSGLRATMKDISADAVGKGLSHAKSLFDKDLSKRHIDAYEHGRRLGRLRGQQDWAGFRALDLVIEAVVEDLEIKKKVFAELEQNVRPDCVIATNTSSLRLSDMVPALQGRDRFVGLHFFNPVDKMPLVEVITLPQTSPQTTARAVNYVRSIGKTPVVVKDGPGFLVNRLLLPWMLESCWCLEEGIAITDMERALKNFGLPMGPFRLIDEVGLDVACKVGHVLHGSLGERFRPAPSLDKVLAHNKQLEKGATPLLGKKSGLGFYKWDKPNGRTGELNLEQMEKVIFGGNTKPKPSEYTDESLVRRLLFPMINEAAMILKEGLVEDAEAVDLGMIFGTGFPPFLGGPLRWADSLGLDKICAELERLGKQFGPRFAPSEALLERSRTVGRFYV